MTRMASEQTTFPQFVSAGDILTDMIRTDVSSWLSRPGGAGWNVARAVARLGLPTACAGSLGTDNFSDDLWEASASAGLDMRFMQRVERPPLLAIVHKTQPPTYYFMGENGADLAFDPSRLPQGWMERVKWAHFVDHKYGAWYRILTCDNRKYSDEKSPAGKTDYHTMGALGRPLMRTTAPSATPQRC